MKIPKEYTGHEFTKQLLNKIIKYGSPPTLNARSAIGYGFSIILDKNGRYDWVGGWKFDTQDIQEDFFLNFKDFIVYYVKTGEVVARGVK